ncbi:hypothetical protein L210DRAFT_3520008 [Boletus edulis BED1]|uniref:DUF6533 domain-containing protein n=1 Tax=Boletus edulis BED1 TaxID=1328754 RepID=A0AAD4C9L7_BOLED|nr:hypothetical protein L210DRAFT_3520008 [Boletus edulis BED1]
MFSDVSFLQSLVLNNYLCLACITVVVYDYALTFSSELDYVWCRPWTWVSTMFVVVRYIGIYWTVTAALTGAPFVPGPLETCEVMYQSYSWAFLVFLSTADLLMILRVYAMWNRSRTILCVLLLLYTIQTIMTVVIDVIYDNPTSLSVIVVQVLDFSFCIAQPGNTSLRSGTYFVISRSVFSAILTVLAVFQTLWQSFEMYKATKQWQPNRYIQKLVKDGIIYFVVNVLYQTRDLLDGVAAGISGSGYLFLEAAISIAFCILIPRFVISIRELYDRDIHRCFHIDTGFGMQSRSNAGADTTVSAMAFADINQGPEVEGGTDNSSDVEMGRVYGSGLNEDSPKVEGRE